MQQTSKYGFNLIEGSDSFWPEPLNENAQKTEIALTGFQTQLDNKLADVQTQLSGQVSDVQTQLSGQVSSVQTQLSGQMSNVQTQLDSQTASLQAQLDSQAANVQAQLDSQLKCVWGTYTGAGTYGSNQPCSLSFPFKPLLVGIWSPSEVSIVGCVLTRGCRIYYSNGSHVNFVTWGERSISWYSRDNSVQQLNEANAVYTYVALGLIE